MASVSKGAGKKPPKVSIKERLSPEQVHRFFANFGIERGVEYRPLPVNRYVVVITCAARWYGQLFGRFVSNCFTLDDTSVPRVEDETDMYRFTYPDDDDIAMLDPFTIDFAD